MWEILTFLRDYWQEIVEVCATILGFLYLYLEYKAKIALWYVGMIWALLYVALFGGQQYIAWAVTWLFYFFASVYGLIAWKRLQKSANAKSEDRITHIKKSWILPTILVTFALMIPFWFVELSANPVAKENFWILLGTVFSTAISFPAMFLLAKKVVEQWIFWIVQNFIYLLINFYNALTINASHFLTAFFFFVYLLISILGYWRWSKELSRGKVVKKDEILGHAELVK